ncbi:MAG TPA: alpha/beta hydrolase-fold protein [Stellaceae bacterium]|nr:alpha/beta hydrolase-fold protein [Stellaceae bacterium]
MDGRNKSGHDESKEWIKSSWTRRTALAALALLLWPLLGRAEILRDQHMPSPALGRDLSYDLYLPPDASRLAGMPVIYLLHGTDSDGADWLDKGDLAATADRLIAAGTMPQAVIVMPDAANSWYVDSPAPAGIGAMGTAIGRDLPAWIEAHYKVSRAREGRAVAGTSMGGFGALRYALTEPDRYAAAAVMSGALWTFLKPDTPVQGKFADATARIFQGAFGDPFRPSLFIAESPLTAARDFPASALRPAFLMICGRNEMFHMREEQEDAQRILAAADIPVETALTGGDHDWDNWRTMLPRVLAFLGSHLKPGAAPVTAGHMVTVKSHS